MSLSLVRRTALHSCAAAALLAFCAPIAAQAQEQTYSFNIPAQALAPALNAFGRQSRQQVVFDGGAFGDRKSAPVVGSYTASQALNALLAGTGFSARLGSRGEFVVAKAAGSGAVEPVPEQTGQVDEVIVTAEKREEQLGNVPVPVTAVQASTLVAANQDRLIDYFQSVPGLNFDVNRNGEPVLGIRGLTGFGGNPVIGIMVDGVPTGSSSILGGGNLAPDLSPGILQRIEVLRGPQGTLYGAETLGGLINYVTVNPSTTKFSGDAQAGVSSVSHGDSAGYNFRATANIPISDTLAIRVSGYDRQDPGFIDNITSGQRDANTLSSAGGFLSALWQPSPAFSAKLSALIQENSTPGSSFVDTGKGLGDLQQSYLPNTGNYNRQLEVYNATLTGHFSGITITSVTGYSYNRLSNTVDQTPGLGTTLEAISNSTNPYGLQHNFNTTEKTSEELRVSGNVSDAFEWLVGGFYTHESSLFDQQLFNATANGQPTELDYRDYYPTTYDEYAVFGDFTYHFTQQLSLKFGFRDSENKQHYVETDTGPLLPFVGFTDPLYYPAVSTSANSFTYLITPEFKLNSDIMLYGRVATGYRPGGPNVEFTVTGAQSTFGADTTTDYEIGSKGYVFGHHIYYEASLYYIDWKNIQLQLNTADDSNTYFANAGAARSQGAELSIEARPVEGLRLGGWFSYSDAVLTKGFPASSTARGVPGDILPYVSKFSGNLTADDEFAVAEGWKLFAGGQLSYADSRRVSFGESANRIGLPAYITLNLHAGVKSGAWTATLFANNLTDSRALLDSHKNGTFFEDAVITPRTVGLNILRQF